MNTKINNMYRNFWVSKRESQTKEFSKITMTMYLQNETNELLFI